MYIEHDKFVQAIHARTKIKLTFFSKEDNAELVRFCAPMDYGPFRREKIPVDRYHLWDYDSDKRTHNLALIHNNIVHMDFLKDIFEPSGFVTWTCNWHITRDWGVHS